MCLHASVSFPSAEPPLSSHSQIILEWLQRRRYWIKKKAGHINLSMRLPSPSLIYRIYDVKHTQIIKKGEKTSYEIMFLLFILNLFACLCSFQSVALQAVAD